MNWIYNTTLAELASFPAPVGMASLLVWTQSGGSPYADEPIRYPVKLGTYRDIALKLGITTRTLRRYRSELEHVLTQARRGWFEPTDAWSNAWTVDGPKDDRWRPLYTKISTSAVELLVTLGHHAPAQTAGAAFRLACALLPELRLRQARGKSYATAHNGRRYGSRYWSPVDLVDFTDKTISKAFDLLVKRGLIVLDRSGKGRRILTDLGALAEIPAVDNVGITRSKVGHVSESKPDKLPTPSPYGPRKLEKQKPSRMRARGDNGSIQYQIGLALVSALPGLQLSGALSIAHMCDSPTEAIEWVKAEWSHLIHRDNPAGTFIQMARKGLTHPSRPSGFGKRPVSGNGPSDMWMASFDWDSVPDVVPATASAPPKRSKPTPAPEPWYKGPSMTSEVKTTNKERVANLLANLGRI